MTETATVTVKTEGITLSLLVWQFMKAQPAGYVERVLLLNPGLADLGARLPVGTQVVLPLAPAANERAASVVVTLWD
jgi:phage tail protein X